MLYCMAGNCRCEVETAPLAIQKLNSSPIPFAVLVTNAEIAHRQHSVLLDRLVAYVHGGGRLILSCHFSKGLPRGLPAAKFFQAFGLPWSITSHHYAIYALNPAGVPEPLSKDVFQAECGLRAVSIRNAAPGVRVHVPLTSSGQLHPEARDASPTIFTRIGAGYLGYVGDIERDKTVSSLTIEMCGVKGGIKTVAHVVDGSLDTQTHNTENQLPEDAAIMPSFVWAKRLPKQHDSSVARRAAARTEHAEEVRKVAGLLILQVRHFGLLAVEQYSTPSEIDRVTIFSTKATGPQRLRAIEAPH